MKKIFLSSLMLLGMALVFTACQDDRDSNPTLVQPDSFKLNNPVNTLVDLAASTAIPFEWSQPNFGGWPAACEYQLEVSVFNDPSEWTISTTDADEDTTGTVFANYATLKSVYKSCSGNMDVVDLNKALNKIFLWEEGDVPQEVTVYVRCRAITAGAKPVYSNLVSLTVNPYYVDVSSEVSDEIQLWYLIGACIGDGSWSIGGDVGVSMIPMYPVYKDDGSVVPGEIQYVGYFPADQGFKLIQVPGSWDAQWGQGDAGYVKNDGGSSDIKLPADGYYMIHLNTATDELTIEPYVLAVGVYSMIAMPGDYQGWDTGANLMDAMSTLDNVENHDWYLKGVTYEDTGLKFAADNSWDVNWGANGFPHGQGTQGGPNITVPAGTYDVYFNDILGTYNFVPKNN
jgi:hypothetical protein